MPQAIWETNYFQQDWPGFVRDVSIFQWPKIPWSEGLYSSQTFLQNVHPENSQRPNSTWNQNHLVCKLTILPSYSHFGWYGSALFYFGCIHQGAGLYIRGKTISLYSLYIRGKTSENFSANLKVIHNHWSVNWPAFVSYSIFADLVLFYSILMRFIQRKSFRWIC